MRCLTRWLTCAWICLALGGLPLLGLSLTSAAQAHTPNSSGNWKQLQPHEKKALAPLAGRWAELTDTQRSKWLVIAQQFEKLSSAEQQVMQARMKEWVALSPAQRNQARLNFSAAQSLSRDEKKSRWDEYQALSEKEKRRLSAGALAPARTAAPNHRPTAPDRLVQPTVRTVPEAALPPRAPIDSKTLLPLPATPSSAATVSPADAPEAIPDAAASEPTDS